MRRLWKLRMIAEEATGYHPKEITSNFSYFIRKSFNPKGFWDRATVKLFTLLIGIILYWTPSVDMKNDLVYIPSIFLKSERIAQGFLIHESFHLKYPHYTERQIEQLCWEKHQ